MARRQREKIKRGINGIWRGVIIIYSVSAWRSMAYRQHHRRARCIGILRNGGINRGGNRCTLAKITAAS